MDHEAAKDASKPFESMLIDLTPPDDQPINIGYVGGVRMPKKKSAKDQEN